MAWTTVEQIMESFAKQGKPLTRERAAVMAHCFNEAEKRGTNPITVFMEIERHHEAERNLGRINAGDGSTPKKPGWQL
jgi:hypothetical protein